MSIIIDRFTGLRVSRQRKWQLRKVVQGRCVVCGQQAVSGGLCLKHFVAVRERTHKTGGHKKEIRCKSRRLEAVQENQNRKGKQ